MSAGHFSELRKKNFNVRSESFSKIRTNHFYHSFVCDFAKMACVEIVLNKFSWTIDNNFRSIKSHIQTRRSIVFRAMGLLFFIQCAARERKNEEATEPVAYSTLAFN